MTDDLKNLAGEIRRRNIPPRYFAAQLKRGVPAQATIPAWPVQPRPPHMDRIGSRRWRRRLVIATYGGWLLVAVLSKLLGAGDQRFLIFPPVLLANALAAFILLSRRTFLNREVLEGVPGSMNDLSRTETVLSASRFKSLYWSRLPLGLF